MIYYFRISSKWRKRLPVIFVAHVYAPERSYIIYQSGLCGPGKIVWLWIRVSELGPTVKTGALFIQNFWLGYAIKDIFSKLFGQPGNFPRALPEPSKMVF